MVETNSDNSALSLILNGCRLYLEARDEKDTPSVFNAFGEYLESVETDGMEPSSTACLEPIQVGSADPRLRSDESNSSSQKPNNMIHTLSWLVDDETGMPKISMKPDLYDYPWAIVSHL